jgi:hypothetical protein
MSTTIHKSYARNERSINLGLEIQEVVLIAHSSFPEFDENNFLKGLNRHFRCKVKMIKSFLVLVFGDLIAIPLATYFRIKMLLQIHNLIVENI